jgi:cation diffusion facilitator family transporter
MRTSNKDLLLKKGEDAARTSTMVLVALSFAKGTVGFTSGSVALLADAMHSFSDIFASIAVWLGLKFSQRKPSERFPYGLYKVETLALLTVSIIIIVSGVEILLDSLGRFRAHYIVSSPHIAVAVAGVSVLTSFFLSHYRIKVGESIGSQALIGEGKHSRIDAFSSMMVVLGVAFNYMEIYWVEAAVGLIISLLVLKLGLQMGKDATLILLDICLRPEQMRRIKEIVEGIAGVEAVHAIKIRRAGPFIFGEAHLEVDEGLTVEKAHEISQKVEEKVKEQIKEMDSFIIHIEPSKRKRYLLAVPVFEDKGLESQIYSHFSSSPYYMLIDMDGGETKSWRVVENPGTKLDRRRGIEAARLLLKNKVNVLVAMKLGEGPFHALRDGMIKIYKLSKVMTVKEIIRELREGKLNLMESPSKLEHADRADTP